MQWRPCRRHSCQNSGLLLWKTWVSNTCGPTFYNHFVLCGNFAIAGAMEPWQHHFFRQRNTEWFRVTNPTQCDSHLLHLDRPRLRRPCTLFFRCTRWLSTFHRGERPVFTRPNQSEREHDLSSKALSFSKERMRKRDRERECVCVRASMTGESRRACFGWVRFIAERNLPSQSSTELEQKS